MIVELLFHGYNDDLAMGAVLWLIFYWTDDMKSNRAVLRWQADLTPRGNREFQTVVTGVEP